MHDQNDVCGFLYDSNFCPDGDTDIPTGEYWYDLPLADSNIRAVEHVEHDHDGKPLAWWEVHGFNQKGHNLYSIRFDMGTPGRIVIACLREIISTNSNSTPLF